MDTVTNDIVVIECYNWVNRLSEDKIKLMKQEALDNECGFFNPNQLETTTAWESLVKTLKESGFSYADSGNQSNGFRFLTMFPCGSKDGWETRQKWDKVAKKLERKCDSFRFISFNQLNVSKGSGDTVKDPD